MKTCTSCHLPKSEFEYSSNGKKNKYKTRCKLCRNADERRRVHLINDYRPAINYGWPAP